MIYFRKLDAAHPVVVQVDSRRSLQNKTEAQKTSTKTPLAFPILHYHKQQCKSYPLNVELNWMSLIAAFTRPSGTLYCIT